MSLTKFLKIIRDMVEETPSFVANWDDCDIHQYNIKNNKEFIEILKIKHNMLEKTFKRQLYYYNFELINIHNGGGDCKNYETYSIKHVFLIKDDTESLKFIKRDKRNNDDVNRNIIETLQSDLKRLREDNEAIEVENKILREYTKSLEESNEALEEKVEELVKELIYTDYYREMPPTLD